MIKSLLRNKINRSKKIVSWLLGRFIRLHNYSYKKITEYASFLNGGVSPKHEITGYHHYFMDRVDSTDMVLDIGCGGGLLAADVAAKAAKVVGIDISADNIAYAKANFSHPRLEYVVGDATKYNFTGRFDKLILSNVLEHIDDRIGLLNKISNLGNTLLLRVPMITREWLAVYKRDHGYPYKLDDTHFIEFDLPTLLRETSQAGWQVESYQINWGEFWGTLKH